MAIRTITRWEADQAPRGTALIKLMQVATEHHLHEIASVFRGALEDELVIGGAAVDPDVKPWLEAIHEIYRRRDRAPHLWDALNLIVIDEIQYLIDRSGTGVSNRRLTELLDELLVGALLPAERQLKQLAEEIAAREGLPYEAAAEKANDANPALGEELAVQKRNREEGREYARRFGLSCTRKGEQPGSKNL